MKFILLVFMQRLLDLFKNKYLLISIIFLVWLIFFDRNDLLSQYEYRQQLNKLKEEHTFYTKETADVQKQLNELTSNKEKLEKFAREKYLMKKADEDIFVIVTEKKEKKSFFGR
ncbi:MAG: septum formation initiator family protein [Mucilaginibacter sp.]|uniref:FtsB family cell division protein n=1 Tax=Mucilaginibacter sp. TaxID=1882438 RepID=UPI0034E4C13C